MICLALLWCLALTVWFQTNAVGEYLCLSFMPDWTGYKGMVSGLPHKDRPAFVDWLSEYFSHFFFTRLVTCEVCLTVWFGILLSLCIGIYGFAAAVLGLFLYAALRKLRS